MPALLTAPPIDLDAAGLLLVAEIEQYLSQIAPTQPGPATAIKYLYSRHGSTMQPWNAHLPLPALPRLDRLRGRTPHLDVTPQQHLDLINRYIQHHGWHQGALWNSAGAVCVLGAQLRVLQAGYGTATTIRRARQRIGNALGHHGQPMPVDTWNDLPTTSRHDVHQLLQHAAAQP
jgi:hypothetical protein